MAKKRKKKRKPSASAAPSAGSIPNAELDVLACIWQEGPVTARRIRDMMWKYRPMAHGSVVTLLTRLEDKGLVSKTKGPVGKAFLFRSTGKPQTTYKKLVKDMVQRVFAGNTAAMVTSLFEAHPPTQDELELIRKAISGAKKRAKKTRR
ncbi:MAG: BlaI/MecI/CopY family transcriptional regulator [Phycisphaerae bacterium]